MLRSRLPTGRCADPAGGRRGGRGLLAAAVVALLALGFRAGAAQETLVERTVAIVGGAVITLSDVRTALALGLVEAAGPDAEREAARRLVERWLVLHEVSRFAPPEPADDAVSARLATIGGRAGSPAALEAILARGGYTVGRLAAWVRDDLRIDAYLEQRFATAGVAAEADVAEYAAGPRRRSRPRRCRRRGSAARGARTAAGRAPPGAHRRLARRAAPAHAGGGDQGIAASG